MLVIVDACKRETRYLVFITSLLECHVCHTFPLYQTNSVAMRTNLGTAVRIGSNYEHVTHCKSKRDFSPTRDANSLLYANDMRHLLVNKKSMDSNLLLLSFLFLLVIWKGFYNRKLLKIWFWSLWGVILFWWPCTDAQCTHFTLILAMFVGK